MSSAYGTRPSELLSGPLGELALDCDVWSVAIAIENRLAGAKDGTERRAIMSHLIRNAEAERLYTERRAHADKS